MDLRSVVNKSEWIRKGEQRKRENEKKKRRKHKFGKMELKQARRGVSSCMMALCAGFFLLLGFSVSYISRGEVGVSVGILGLVALVLAVVGLRRGIEGFKERNKDYTSCKVGTACNAVLTVIFVALFIRGLF